MLYIIWNIHYKGFPGSLVVKNPPANARDADSVPGWGRRKWLTICVFLPGKSDGERNLEGYSPCGHKRIGHNLEKNIDI